MQDPFKIPGTKINQSVTSKKRITDFIFNAKLSGPSGFIFLLTCSLFFAFVISKYGMLPGIMIIVLLIGLPVVYGLVAFPQFGLVVFLTCAYFIMWIGRLGIDFPLGTLMDLMEVLFILGLFIQQKKKADWSVFKGPMSTMILIWILYNLIEVINPTAESRLAWVYTVRSVAVIMLMYFIFLYNIRTKDFLKFILKMWLLFSLIGALYGLKQQYIGFSDVEERYLHSDPNIELLLFIGGQWRKFSIYNDPVAFSYNMVVSSLLCLGILTGPISRNKKIMIGAIALLCLLSMLYSGTRGAFVLPPVALVMFAILKFNKQVMIAGIVFIVIMATAIFIPTSNSTLYRFQTAFKPSEDASFNVRKMNQKRIQPFIQTHPLGGGLGATGTWGQRFAPNSMLANFPPDSGYVRVAVEMGWLGLFLFCMLMFTILRVGIHHYFAIKDPELKSYCLAMVLIIFAFHVGNYPQEAIVQFPSNVYFYLAAALIEICYRIDQQSNPITLTK